MNSFVIHRHLRHTMCAEPKDPHRIIVLPTNSVCVYEQNYAIFNLSVPIQISIAINNSQRCLTNSLIAMWCTNYVFVLKLSGIIYETGNNFEPNSNLQVQMVSKWLCFWIKRRLSIVVHWFNVLLSFSTKNYVEWKRKSTQEKNRIRSNS